jgi:hypothetical protein
MSITFATTGSRSQFGRGSDKKIFTLLQLPYTQFVAQIYHTFPGNKALSYTQYDAEVQHF